MVGPRHGSFLFCDPCQVCFLNFYSTHFYPFSFAFCLSQTYVVESIFNNLLNLYNLLLHTSESQKIYQQWCYQQCSIWYVVIIRIDTVQTAGQTSKRKYEKSISSLTSFLQISGKNCHAQFKKKIKSDGRNRFKIAGPATYVLN